MFCSRARHFFATILCAFIKMWHVFRCLFTVTILVMVLATLYTQASSTSVSQCAPQYLGRSTTMYLNTKADIQHLNCKHTLYTPMLDVRLYHCSSPLKFIAVHKSILQGMKQDLFVFIPSDQNIPLDWYECILNAINRCNVRLNVHAVISI